VRPSPRLIICIALSATLLACGGSSSSPGSASANNSNVLPIVVNSGPANLYFNGAFTTVTVCVPGSTTSCQSIGGVLVDTGSSGLRILSSALTLSLPQQLDPSGNPVAECGQFEDGFTWGPVASADVMLGSERAPSVPIQVIGSPQFSTVPRGCTSSGLTSESTLDTLQANGVLGIGLFRQDCGFGCALPGSSNPGVYFSCVASGCSPIAEPIERQLQNPVAMFPRDNNGVIVSLPSVPEAGAFTVSGVVIFGIGTQSNNALGAAKVLTTDLDGTIVTTFNGKSYTGSFIDSGSNGLYFLDPATTGLPVCPDQKDFYCPSTTQMLMATLRGTNSNAAPATFSIANADALPGAFNAFNDVGGPNPGAFDWGLPFFFGRQVFTAIEGASTPGGSGPFFAF